LNYRNFPNMKKLGLLH